MMLIWVLICAAIVMGEQYPDPDLDRGTERPRVFCGRALAEARAMYCFGSEPYYEKKSEHKPLLTVLTTIPSDNVWPWLPKSYAIAMKLNNRRKRDIGLVDECCLKPCYISELLSYC